MMAIATLEALASAARTQTATLDAAGSLGRTIGAGLDAIALLIPHIDAVFDAAGLARLTATASLEARGVLEKTITANLDAAAQAARTVTTSFDAAAKPRKTSPQRLRWLVNGHSSFRRRSMPWLRASASRRTDLDALAQIQGFLRTVTFDAVVGDLHAASWRTVRVPQRGRAAVVPPQDHSLELTQCPCPAFQPSGRDANHHA